jgi:hypothetical protein
VPEREWSILGRVSRAVGVGVGFLSLLGVGASQVSGVDGAVAKGRGGTDGVLDHRTLRGVHLDLLGRPPFQADYARWLGKPAGALVDEVLASREFWERWYEEQLYYFLLINNFRPETERANAISKELHEGRLDVREAIHRIALTSSFDQRNPGADTFVTVVMEQLLGLEVQKTARELEIGKKIYDGTEGNFLGTIGRCQADVVRIAMGSKLFPPHFLAREHERLVHSRAEAKDLAAWSARFEKDPAVFGALVREWIASDAYRARLGRRLPQSNRLFVRSLFVDLMDRAPTQAEAEPLREALDGLADPAPLRSIAIRMILDSGRAKIPVRKDITDPAAWVKDLFRRWLGREPTEAELSTFVESLADPACRPQTVVYAILTGGEYP